MIVLRLEQLSKHPEPIEVIELGITIDVKEQLAKQAVLKDLTLEPIVTPIN